MKFMLASYSLIVSFWNRIRKRPSGRASTIVRDTVSALSPGDVICLNSHESPTAYVGFSITGCANANPDPIKTIEDSNTAKLRARSMSSPFVKFHDNVYRSSLQYGVERVAQPVGHQIERRHGSQDGASRQCDHPPRPLTRNAIGRLAKIATHCRELVLPAPDVIDGVRHWRAQWASARSTRRRGSTA